MYQASGFDSVAFRLHDDTSAHTTYMMCKIGDLSLNVANRLQLGKGI